MNTWERDSFLERDHVWRNWIRYTAELAGFADILQQPVLLQELTQLGYDERALETMLYALQSMSPPAVAVVEGKYVWIGPRSEAEELFQFELMRRWFSYATSLKTGKPVGGLEPWFFQKLTETMHASAERMIPGILPYVQKHIPIGHKGLDIGGNHGLFASALNQSGYPMTVVDLPHVVEQARETTANLPFLGCNVVKEAPKVKDEYNWALMIRFLRMLGPSEIQQAAQNISSVLREDARLVIVDAIRGLSTNADMVGINMVLNTPNGNTYTLEQWQSLLRPWELDDLTELSTENTMTIWRRTK